MINYLNFENHIKEIQALQQTSSNQVIMATPDEVYNLSDTIKNLSKQTLINQIEEKAQNNDEILIGKYLDTYV